jgi:hypothetical protein
MKTKVCKVCNIEKELLEFHKCIKQNATYLRSYCKECGRKQRRQWRNDKKDGLWYVYYLPEEHYVGITSLIEDRLKTHEREGKIIDNYEIIAKYNHPALALMTEALFHYCDYNGCNYN